jgi:hypothetical protein
MMSIIMCLIRKLKRKFALTCTSALEPFNIFRDCSYAILFGCIRSNSPIISSFGIQSEIDTSSFHQIVNWLKLCSKDVYSACTFAVLKKEHFPQHQKKKKRFVNQSASKKRQNGIVGDFL